MGLFHQVSHLSKLISHIPRNLRGMKEIVQFLKVLASIMQWFMF